MPYILQHNRPAIENKIARLTKWLGIDNNFDGFMDYVLATRKELGIPNTIKELDVGNNQFTRMAEMAVVDPTASGNPVSLEVEDCVKMYQQAYAGEIG